MSRSLRLLARARPSPRLSLPLGTTLPRRAASSFQNEPAPPRLPAAQQAEFERLQRAAEEELYSHTKVAPTTSAPAAAVPSVPSSASPGATSRPAETPATAAATETDETATATFSGGIRKGAPPEFHGDTNPKTGEVGGPKNEPLRWGSRGDYSFNGRVTDF